MARLRYRREKQTLETEEIAGLNVNDETMDLISAYLIKIYLNHIK